MSFENSGWKSANAGGRACLFVCVFLLGLVFDSGLPFSAIAAHRLLPPPVAAAEYSSADRGAQAAISPIGRCSGSAMVCQVPGTLSAQSAPDHADAIPSTSILHVPSFDEEHALVYEVLSTIDRHFYDLKNDEGAAASSVTHTYNGMAVEEVRATTLQTRKLPSRQATYKEIRKLVKGLGDRCVGDVYVGADYGRGGGSGNNKIFST